MLLSLNGNWLARTDAEENGLAENWACLPIKSEFEVKVPGCIQQLDCLAGEYPPHNDMRNGYKNTFFMEKSVCLPELKTGQRCRLRIGGVIPSCHIWVNGTYVLKNSLGLNSINADITDYIVTGGNRITVAVTEQYASLVTGMRFAGMDWSGIYSGSFVEITGALYFQDAYISLKNKKAGFCCRVWNMGVEDFEGPVEIKLNEKRTEIRISVPTRSFKEIEEEVDVRGLPRWSSRVPELVNVSAACTDVYGNPCGCEFRTGLREITVKKDRILIDGLPTFFAGTGSEYYSPSIAPLTDREMIRKRYDALKAYGFHFYRFHTHVPTEEEMCVADEMGMMLDVEFGLVSNFNKATPVEKGMEMLANFVEQSRRHPSVVVYCLGNEGSQLMVDSYIEQRNARMGYQIIKEHTDNQLAVIAFGMQGELPKLPNDFETPHLWSENFLWSYDGLTDIPWEYLGSVVSGKPCIIHEYGKFGVWPSRKEEKDCTVEGGIKPDYGTQSYWWLKENGMEKLEERLVANSRRAAVSFSRIILEEARRQPFCSGYALWTFFRRSGSSAGLSDDLGRNLNGNPEVFRNGVNADVAVLMDRGFLNRSFPCELKQNIEISLSNFGLKDLNGTVKAAVYCGDDTLAETEKPASALRGETRQVLRFSFSVPAACSGKKLLLCASFSSSDGEAAANQWELWAFDTSADSETRAFLHIEDLTLFRALKKIFPRAQRLSSVDSIVTGCRSWRNPRLAWTARQEKDILILSDVYDSVISECIENGCSALLLDSGRLPEEWMLPPVCEELGDRDTGRFFNSFRAGWDKGNLVTIVNEDTLLGNFPQEGYCGLQFFDMMQSARVMKPEAVEDQLQGRAKRVIASICKVPVTAQAYSVVQDPNAVKEQEASVKRSFQAREQGYYLKMNDSLAVCTLKLTDNPSGIALLRESVHSFSRMEEQTIINP